MTEQRTRQLITLPPSLMASIKAISSEEDMPPGHRLSGVLMVIWGYAWFEQQGMIDPSSIALPEAQLNEVRDMLANGVAIDSIAGVNLGLSWMNQGPSGYDD